MASGFTLDFSDLQQGVRDYKRELIDAVYDLLSAYAPQLESVAKGTHPWVNRTGKAEAALHADVLREAAGTIVTLYLEHGVYYGWWLETKWGGKWGVIVPVLEASYGPIMADLQALVGR